MNNLFVFQLMALLLSKNYVCAAEINGKIWKGEGTTPNLESIVIGRCYEYIAVVNPSVAGKNCSEIWKAFKSAFINKDPCNIFPSDYELFINLSLHAVPPDKSLFWENNQLLVTGYSDRARRFMPLSDTLFGGFGDFLTWCGKAGSPGIDYNSCPRTEECEHNPVESFWRIASANYAKQSSGVINILLNGSATGGAYPVQGFFAVYELPNFQKEKISEIQIWVMDDVGGPDLESCGKGSVQILENRLKALGYSHTCTDNYRSVRLLQCLDHLNHPDCAAVSLLHGAAQIYVGPWKSPEF
uniref:ADP-ribosyl cyclase/cyclic ADP-ribose hydrolase n=1 Tax=Sphenodon punctatus TaxID=8508 RepID=A0A8D0H577_SPHPU